MIFRSRPDPAKSAHRYRLLLTVLALLVPPIAGAQTPEVSTVLAMSGSRIPDGVVRGADGALYAVASASSSATGALFFRVADDGSSVETLYQFAAGDGNGTAGALLLASDGMFYGTAQFSSGGTSVGGGTVFRIASDGTGFTKLHEFGPSTTNNVNSNPINSDGVSPFGALIEGSSDGFLYGVTRFGGPAGTGTVYKIAKDGSGFEVLWAFAAVTSAANATIVNADGAHARDGLVESAGFFYGTTNAGGANGQGTIFRLFFDGSQWQFTVLHAFTKPTAPSGATTPVNEDGAAPLAGLAVDSNGLLYGTTTVGGEHGVGVLYSIAPDGSPPTTLHHFASEEGSLPVGKLLVASDGRLYGTTSAGGQNADGGASTNGTVYSIALDGSGFTKLDDLENATGSGGNGQMVQLDATEFIGTTGGGGRCGNGTIFRLSLAGETVEGDTTCGESNNGGGGGGGAFSWLMLALLATLVPAVAVQRGSRSRNRTSVLAAVRAGSSNTREAQRLSHSAPRSRPARTM